MSYHNLCQIFWASSREKKLRLKDSSFCWDREKSESLLNKVKETENIGVSKSLKSLVLPKKHPQRKESFGILERNAVDMEIIQGLCANRIPFNVLRNPQFLEMVNVIKKAPDWYMPSSCVKGRTVLLDKCVKGCWERSNFSQRNLVHTRSLKCLWFVV